MDYFDLHCDTISECYNKNEALNDNKMQLSLARGEKINRWIQTYAIWIKDEMTHDEAYDYFNNVYSYFLKQLEKSKRKITFCRCAKEINTTFIKNENVALLSIEGSRVLGRELSRVQEFYDKGVRMMTLTWNGKTDVADGCMVENAGGLSDFGIKVVKKMEEVGMLVDVSHLAERGFWDVVSITGKPFIATHSNSKAICNHPRNLTDKQFNIFVQRKGLVGMNFYPLFINGTMEGDVEELMRHIDHFLELGGDDVIAMGSDFDGAKMPHHMNGIEDVGYLYDLLVRRYGKEKADKFYFENAYNFFRSKL